MQKLYRMSEAAEILGVTVKTLQRWDKVGKVHFIRTPNGKRRLPESELYRLAGLTVSETTEKHLVIYARVSSHEQKLKGDLKRQIDCLKEKVKLDLYENVIPAI